MSDYTFNEKQIAARLARLEITGQVAFVLSCVERLLPNYRAFQREHQWGDADVLSRAISLGWEWLSGEAVPEQVLSNAGIACEQQAPDTEDFQSRTVSPALDAAMSASALMALIQTQDTDKAVETATLCRDTVDMFVQELENMPANSSDLESRIRLHPLMQAELKRQDDDLAALEAGVDPQQLATGWRSPEVSNIGLS